MDLRMAVDEFDHPAWASAAATVAGYLLLLAVVFGVLFVVPWLVVSSL